MAENSHISWTDHTFNPWIGCTRVSPACDGCYAAELMGDDGGRFKRVTWGGPGKGEGTRDRTKDWSKPRKWEREAAAAVAAWRSNPFAIEETPKPSTFVFCASLADVFDNAVDPTWRRDLFQLIRETPHLTWLLLTKRPGMIVKLFLECAKDARGVIRVSDWAWPSNAAMGCTVINQEEADRDIPKLLEAKARLKPAFAFLSMEPLLGPVDIAWAVSPNRLDQASGIIRRGSFSPGLETLGRVDWVITGGETDQGAHKARPADPAWYRSLRDQCAAAGVPFHFKQWGEWQGGVVYSEGDQGGFARHEDGQQHGGKPSVWWDGDAFDGRISTRVGKNQDPCTLDGVRHLARPAV